MFVHAFDGEDYVDNDSRLRVFSMQNKFVENDVKSSLSFSKSFSKTKKAELPSG
jgi:hypothetical protein